jgi:hypothetical protein
MENETTEPTEPTVETTPEPSFKEDPKYQAMAKQLAELQTERTARVEADKTAKKTATEAKRKREDKALQDAGRFDELKARYDENLENVEVGHAKAILKMNLVNELVKVGFKNDNWLNGAVGSYDAETHGDIASYVSALSESDKEHLVGADGRKTHTPPGAAPVTGSTVPLRGDRLKQYRTSDDPEKRKQAYAVMEKWLENNDTLDGLYKQ